MNLCADGGFLVQTALSVQSRSGECLCGAFAKSEELEEIELWFPETGAYIRDLEAQAKALGHRWCTWGGQRQGSAAPPGPLCSSCSLFEEVGTDG